MALCPEKQAWHGSGLIAGFRKWFDVDGLDNLTAMRRRKSRQQWSLACIYVAGIGRPGNGSLPASGDLSSYNNPLMEWVQTRGRMRSNKAMIGRKQSPRHCVGAR